MFFIMGISSSEKKLDFIQTMLCSTCGQFGRYEVYMTYTFLSLFFIPLFKWNKRFYVRSSCCNTIYAIDNDLGLKIMHGENITLSEQDLHIINNNYSGTTQKRCNNCGYISDSEFAYCPKCGNRL